MLDVKQTVSSTVQYTTAVGIIGFNGAVPSASTAIASSRSVVGVVGIGIVVIVIVIDVLGIIIFVVVVITTTHKCDSFV